MTTTTLTRAVAALAAGIAVLFGIATLFAGGRVLLGADPGYVVFRPLLIYNTTMGLVYIAVGLALWRNHRWARNAAGAVFGLNLIVLVSIIAIRSGGGAVAVDSLRAMAVRTIVWLALFLVAVLLARSTNAAREGSANLMSQR